MYAEAFICVSVQQTPVHTPSSATQVPFSHFMGPGPSPSDHPELFEVATGRPSEYTVIQFFNLFFKAT